MKIIRADCLVIGSGVSGSLYAYLAQQAGRTCVLVSASNELESGNSLVAQGGLVYSKEMDWNLLRGDIFRASNDESYPEAVDILIQDGPKVVEDILLNDLQVNFDRSADGELRFTQEAAHSKKRIIFSKDQTGKSILRSIQSRLGEGAGTQTFRESIAVDLLTLSQHSIEICDRYRPHTCIGAYIFDSKTREVYAVIAKKTILATGGMGQIYRHTTNSEDACGHGLTMAYRVGARLTDLEYVQFHPTAFYQEGERSSFLISEAVRGEGGILINREGIDFMSSYHALKSLAPRDLLSRAIHQEMLRTNSPCVYIDLSRISKEYIPERFPHIYAQCLERGIDMIKDPIPVAPAAHYHCGGVLASMDGRTNVTDLNVIGEVACTGLHGSNRLASTSLLECLVMAKRTFESDLSDLSRKSFYRPDVKDWIPSKKPSDENLIKQDLEVIRNTMWNYVGVVRTQEGLNRAKRILDELKSEIDEFYAHCLLSRDLLNLRSAVLCARLIVYAAFQNKRSSGCHYRKDSPDEN